jgi:hypothetical protein
MSIGTMITVVTLAVATLCGLGSGLCRQIILEEVRRKRAAGEEVGYPWSPFGFSKVIRMHEEYYPDSRIRAANRFLTYCALVCMASLALIGIIFAFTNPPR